MENNDAVATMELLLTEEAVTVPPQDDSAPEPTSNIEYAMSADIRVIEDDYSKSKRLLDDGYEMDFLMVEKVSLVDLLDKWCCIGRPSDLNESHFIVFVFYCVECAYLFLLMQ